jgi:hypothetical protein
LVLDRFIANFLPELNLNTAQKKLKFFFLGMNPITSKVDNVFLETVAIMFMFYIWECKLQKKQPVYSGLLNDIFFSIEKMRKYSGMLRDAMTLNLTLFRNWYAETSSRR